ncbi:general secretion pathway protein GspK [Thalassomonas viridans]|uniref:General secretion pathway protein GspK n=1 Tax=Thalassomonas viridans TaxID=137584 RepID=A0AAE9Z0S9_9GAMM|nr:type II secretion system protein GspK [Thalassomonas viridans]WDE03950.1 general secretion pathway protein GspK [Thalassomonas viridans]
MTGVKGIALVQILIITAILSTVALYITKTARQQVKMAHWAMDKSQAGVMAHSARAQILFELLTNTWTEKKDSQNMIVAKWNFYDKDFQLEDGVNIKIQDQAGLINLHYPKADMVIKRLLYAGINATEARRISAVLRDWQDSDTITSRYGEEHRGIGRNGPMPDLREWLHQQTLSDEQFESIKGDFSLAGVGHVNLLNSSFHLLAALTNADLAREIVQRREAGELDRQTMTQITGLVQDEDIFYAPSNKQQITITAKYGEAEITQKVLVELSPYYQSGNAPYNIMQNQGG